MTPIILTADDFGFDVAINEAVEQAHKEGVLTAASLMVSGAAAGDAISRARRMSSLAVGLHIVLVQGTPVLPPRDIPALVRADGTFRDSLGAAGFHYFFHPRARRQLTAEIGAQFEAFRATGLTLDHVNAHNHLHLHPTISAIILSIGRQFGMRAVRLPYEPLLPSWHAAGHGLGTRAAATATLAPWIALLRRRLRNAGIKFNDFVFGLHDSGRMREDLVLNQLRHWPSGIGELYFHPATRRTAAIARALPAYRCEDELHALTSSKLRAVLNRAGLRPVAFADL